MTQSQRGPRKLNKLLIALGVLAFGLIVTDRVMEAFQADDELTDVAALESGVDASPEQIGEVQTLVAEPAAPTAELKTAVVGLPQPDMEALVRLENLFGSPVVLVSSSEPSYVVTEDNRRFDVGGVVDELTTLAGITSNQLIFEQSGDLLVISLPEPALQQ